MNIIFADDHSLEGMTGSSKQILQGMIRINTVLYLFNPILLWLVTVHYTSISGGGASG